ncbi:type I restriction endonuclease subunit R [Candidatus Poribacteria bacterium]|nr:type I restriction endonuclease subunit R [Candidatus Poribacteria bacterium]MYB65218.1 type I restriction endonuclease subunit R [Candidatus Poribacteria bacterium]MYI94980.1 type I restriction endonuclease subunit R [Candidatus Poribacteria bacterium]
MQNPYSEDQLVEQPAIALLKEIGWQTQECLNEFEYDSQIQTGREAKSEVVLTDRLRAALARLNPNIPSDAITTAIEVITQSRAVMNKVEANREIYSILKDGVKITDTDPNTQEVTDIVLKVIDWENPENNDFFAATQFWITGEMYTRRPDLIGFVNGIPLVLMEFKRIDENIHAAYNDNLRDYKDTIPNLFWYNAIIVVSNGSESRLGSFTAEWEHFTEWKRIESEDEQQKISLEVLLHGVCQPDRLLDIVENFTLFMEVQGGTIKLIAKNHQYLGVNNAIKALQENESNLGKLGVFWHTQGSGKSVSMIFFAQKILRKIQGHWTFVIVTDRKELDNQIYKTFASASGVITQQEGHAENIKHLRKLLSQDHRYIFTLIHKFQTTDNEPHPVLSDRSDIIVITDEAHRSQYDTLALNMRTALPNAAYIAFTGTPLMVGEEKTREVFGDEVSVYDFKQSIEDKATVPLYYENRVPRLQLTNDELNRDFEQILEDAELDEAQEARLEREFAREYHLITRDERLETIAEDIVSHFIGRGYRGKAMVISIDKPTAVKMYNKVQKYWQQKIQSLISELDGGVARDREKPLKALIQYMEETDMAVVVSQSQNEIDDLKKRDVDITPHRKRMIREDLDTKFKNPDDPFRIVFLCAMWTTGFDVPSCSTIYLDKPQRNHTLMQTIARANRVYKEKVNGLIVDYIGIFRNLEKALAIYATGSNGDGSNPIADKSKLIEELRNAIAEISAFCNSIGVDLAQIDAADSRQRIQLIPAAVNQLLVNDETKRNFLEKARNVYKLFKAILPDTEANAFSAICSLINIIARKIKNLREPVDISEVEDAVEELLDRSIAPEGYIINAGQNTYDSELIDLSQIDFEQLRNRLSTEHKRTEAEKLRGALNRKLIDLIRLNKTRMDFREKFEQMIEEYNNTGNDDDFLEQLFGFTEEIQEESQRADTEELLEEELAIVDILTKPNPALTLIQREEVKTSARRLLDKLKRENLVLDWRKQQQLRAQAKHTVQTILDEGLPDCYTEELFGQKSDAVYQHVYDSYFGEGKSIYTET